MIKSKELLKKQQQETREDKRHSLQKDLCYN